LPACDPQHHRRSASPRRKLAICDHLHDPVRVEGPDTAIVHMNLSGQCVLDRPTGKHHHRHPRPTTPRQPRYQDPWRQATACAKSAGAGFCRSPLRRPNHPTPDQNPEERGQFRLSLDNSLVLARFAFSHAADCRSMMAFGQAHLLDDTGKQHTALGMMVDHVFPQRTAQLRASTTQNIKATNVVGMEIETASGRIRL
jgi:hypothetical protein